MPLRGYAALCAMVVNCNTVPKSLGACAKTRLQLTESRTVCVQDDRRLQRTS